MKNQKRRFISKVSRRMYYLTYLIEILIGLGGYEKCWSD